MCLQTQDLALILSSLSSSYLCTYPVLVLHFMVCWAAAGTHPSALMSLLSCQRVNRGLQATEHPTSRTAEKGKTTFWPFTFWFLSYSQQYSGSQVFGAICSEKTYYKWWWISIFQTAKAMCLALWDYIFGLSLRKYFGNICKTLCQTSVFWLFKEYIHWTILKKKKKEMA